MYQAEDVVGRSMNVFTMLQMYYIDLLQELNKTVEAEKPVSELLDEIHSRADLCCVCPAVLSWLWGKGWGRWWFLSATSG